MFCGECGSLMSVRIHEALNEGVYFCPNKKSNRKNGIILQDQKWKRGEIEEHGCGMNSNLNIPITEKCVWDAVMDAVSKSTTFKEDLKEESLQSKYSNNDETDRKIKT